MKLNYGDRAAREVSERIAAPVATITALKAIPAANRVADMLVMVVADGSMWKFHGTSSLTGDDILVVTPTAGSGRWLRNIGAAKLIMPIAFGTADAAVLLTVPTGCLLHLREVYWTITTSFSGGASSAIGVSSTKTNFTTKGDILGGAGGDVAAGLTTALSPTMGTIGAAFDTLAKRRVHWKPADILRFDRITSVFTAGAGAVNAIVDILHNDGA